MTGVYVLVGGITLIVVIFTAMDWLAQRRQRTREHDPTHTRRAKAWAASCFFLKSKILRVFVPPC